MGSSLTIYLAWPISGHSYDDVVNYYVTMRHTMEDIGFRVLHPMIGKEALRNEVKFKAEGYGNPESTNHAIKARDQWMVRQADIILADLSTAETPSIGCICELAWADVLGKHKVVVMDKGNPNYHAFVLEMADIVYPELGMALDYLQNYEV